MFLQAKGYRFEVYIPCAGLHGTGPSAPTSYEGNRGYNSAPAAMYPQYCKYILAESIHNRVTVERGTSLFVEQPNVSANPEVNRTLKDVIVSVIAHGSTPTQNLTSKGGGVVPADALPYIMDLMQRTSAERNSIGTTNFDNCDDPNAPNSAYDTGTNRVLPKLPVNVQTKTLQDVAFDFLKKTEWGSFHSFSKGKDFVNSDLIMRPGDVTVTQLQKAEYVGMPPQQMMELYEDRVLAAFGMSRLVFGIAGGRSTTTVGSASVFKGKNAQEVAVGLEEKNYQHQVALCQSELSSFISWLYRTSMSVFDAIGLQELFERETKEAKMSHDRIVELIKEYEILVEDMDPSLIDEVEEDDKMEIDKDIEEKEEQKKLQIIENKASPPSYMSLKKQLREVLQKRLSLSFSEYAKISQWLFYLALCVHGTATVHVEFTKNKAYEPAHSDVAAQAQ
tara:strand:- start:5416 stop:6759 length:1344 start_codon:yes stop_codon:yes gene_type:complete